MVSSGEKDSDGLPEVYPSIRAANSFKSAQGRRTHLLELTSVQLSNRRAYKCNSLGEILVKKSPRENSRSTDKQPEKSRPEGMPDVSDMKVRHVDAIKLGFKGYVRPLPEYV